jgi:hypothetical protein
MLRDEAEYSRVTDHHCRQNQERALEIVERMQVVLVKSARLVIMVMDGSVNSRASARRINRQGRNSKS